jgi:Zn-dependent peptidase ImmA (M78 family)
MMRSSAIKVGARTYAIACLEDEEFELLLAQKGIHNESIKSFIDYDEQLIVLRNRLHPEHIRELILHELIHACLEDSGVTQDEIVEQFVSVLAPRLNDLLINKLENVISELTL